MKLSELMKGYTIDANYEGWVTNDDYVFAIDTNPGGKTVTTPADFVVVEMGIAGLDSNLNPITQDKTYIRAGQNTRIKGDAAIAMLSAGALSVGYLLLNLFPSANTGKFSEETLFGSTSLLTLSSSDVCICLSLAVFVVVFFVFFYHRIFAVTFDERFAQAGGIHVSVYRTLIAAVSGVVIVLAMKLVGALLISALIIFPALSAMRLFRNFRAVTICSAVLSVAGSMLGLLLSILFSTPIGATVVVIHVILFGIFSAVNAIRGK